MNCFHGTIRYKSSVIIIVSLLAFQWMPLQAQTSGSEYLLGSEEKLEMQVHIWGEVRNPGEYRVSYDTDMIELISIAGGPTKDASLNNVQLTRPRIAGDVDQETLKKIAERAGDREISKEFVTQQLKASAREVVVFDVNKYLSNRDSETPPPVLRPGDIVHVKTTKWYRWREFIQALHQVALIASVYAWYLRSK
ncbi:MAG: SLBB domain-containing protein [candidate division KSB1 bacterium]|nr:SLBB domain-containing protein [candidate division KSB1 bacterium]